MARDQQVEDLTVPEALRLLGSVPFGRVVFTSKALPAIRPVRHILASNQIIIGASPYLVFAAPPGPSEGTVVAYEADQLDPTGNSGWSVVVIGRVRLVTDLADTYRYRQLLSPTTGPEPVVAISADVVTGFRLLPERELTAGVAENGRAETAPAEAGRTMPPMETAR